ncbi:MAG: bifunctional 5,10-methylenetetrahydrofolate dehydrogenase/5,10-methenyltetrahydrofolate cyclohydrolase [Lachnospiraceae bacterium]|nr:bifunctional 5,10-methylenetetrahydrofolate dehydrogenase/5,10-methenyltetrahydrofolate cyclohydrolase [Lachnospiraceae bacterium]
MQELRGMPVAKEIAGQAAIEVEKLKEKGIIPKLAVVRVGEREDDLSYERGLMKRFEAVGAVAESVVFPFDVTQEELENGIKTLNEDESVHGILVFRPLPKHLNEDSIKELVTPEKDVDCMGSINNAHVFAQDGKGHAPCTPQAVIEMLDFYGYELTGKKAVVVGRSMVVGKPLAQMLLKKNATVTICHTKTADLREEVQAADFVFACAGVAKMLDASYIREGQIVIDVGINVSDGKLCGDVDYDSVREIAAAITPVPGGVGSVTTSVLLKHVLSNAVKKYDFVV